MDRSISRKVRNLNSSATKGHTIARRRKRTKRIVCHVWRASTATWLVSVLFVTSLRATWSHIVPRDDKVRRVTSHRAAWRHIAPRDDTSRRVTTHRAVWRHSVWTITSHLFTMKLWFKTVLPDRILFDMKLSITNNFKIDEDLNSRVN